MQTQQAALTLPCASHQDADIRRCLAAVLGFAPAFPLPACFLFPVFEILNPLRFLSAPHFPERYERHMNM